MLQLDSSQRLVLDLFLSMSMGNTIVEMMSLAAPKLPFGCEKYVFYCAQAFVVFYFFRNTYFVIFVLSFAPAASKKIISKPNIFTQNYQMNEFLCFNII